MIRRLVWLLVTLFCVPLAVGQISSYPKFEFYGGYLIAGEFPYNEFQFPLDVHVESDFGAKHGLEAAVIRNFGRHLGLKFDFSAQFHHDEGQGLFNLPCSTGMCPLQQLIVINPKLFNFLVGPELKLRNHTRFTPYGHLLFGVAYTTASFTTHSSALNLSLSTSETGFSTAVGVGLDVRIARHVSWRNQLDINPKYVGRNDNGARIWLHDLRFSVGLLVH